MPFNLQTTENKARRGELQTTHGKIQTPCFMPVATQGAFKGGVSAQDVGDLKAQILLSNTYHLHLRPGEKTVQKLGGLHQMINWKKPILTDSGGFQIFSLAKMRKITEEEATFNSHLNGEKISLSPEKAIQIQNDLGSDIIMVLDECTPYPCSKSYVEQSLKITHNWAKRCKNYHKNKKQLLFGIVQGSTYADLRIKSAQYLQTLDFDGYALGGLAVGEPATEMYKILEIVEPYLPSKKPRYLMGVGTPPNLLEAVERGIDMFDCVLPARNARHGTLYTSSGILKLKNAGYKTDTKPIDQECKCSVCQKYSRGYLRHLFNANEILALRLSTLHNLFFYLNLMQQIRQSIEKKQFNKFKTNFLEKYQH